MFIKHKYKTKKFIFIFLATILAVQIGGSFFGTFLNKALATGTTGSWVNLSIPSGATEWDVSSDLQLACSNISGLDTNIYPDQDSANGYYQQGTSHATYSVRCSWDWATNHEYAGKNIVLYKLRNKATDKDMIDVQPIAGALTGECTLSNLNTKIECRFEDSSRWVVDVKADKPFKASDYQLMAEFGATGGAPLSQIDDAKLIESQQYFNAIQTITNRVLDNGYAEKVNDYDIANLHRTNFINALKDSKTCKDAAKYVSTSPPTEGDWLAYLTNPKVLFQNIADFFTNAQDINAACTQYISQVNGNVYIVNAAWAATSNCAAGGATTADALKTCVAQDATYQKAIELNTARQKGAEQAVIDQSKTGPKLSDAGGCGAALDDPNASVDISQLIEPFPAAIMCFVEKYVLNGIQYVSKNWVDQNFSSLLTVGIIDNPVAQSVARVFINFINSLFLLLALISIFITTLKIDIPSMDLKSWQLKRMIPTIIATIILVNYSLSIANLVIAIMDSLVGYFGAGGGNFFSFGTDPNSLMWSVGGIPWGLLAFRILFLVAFLLVIIYLMLVLWVRKLALVLLAMFAPVPYLANAIPISSIKELTGSWWKNFMNWAFMGPLVAALLYAASIAITSATETKLGIGNLPINFGAGEIIPVSPSGFWAGISLTNMVLVGIILYLAATMPLKLGGAVMSAVQKATTGRAGKLAGTIAKGTAGFYASKAARGLGIPSIEEIKKGFAENRRVQLAKASEKGAKKREKAFGGVSAMTDIFENYWNMKGIGKLPFSTARQKKAEADLLAKNRKVRELKDSGANADEIVGATKEADAARMRLMNIRPTNYNTRVERLGRESEELKKIASINRSEELNSLLDKAIMEKNQTRASAIMRQMASNADENEYLNRHNFSSGREGMQAFTREVLIGKLGMNRQQALELEMDISNTAEKNGHMQASKTVYMEDGILDHATATQHQDAIRAETIKMDSQKQAINFNRLAYGYETPDRVFHLTGEGKELLRAIGPGLREQLNRMNVNAVENLTANGIIQELEVDPQIDKQFLQVLVAKRLGYTKDDKEQLKAIKVDKYVEHLNGGGDWQSYKATIEASLPAA
ncbi:MAG: hypothetical protein PHU42_00925 [Patescibacteria group bacterium]|nr:hypothetical protein [Patescibacteria group bacterium]